MVRTRPVEEADTVQAVARALTILEGLAQAGGPVGLSELAQRVGLKLTTTHRLLSTLVACGFAEQEPITQRYRLGIKALEIGNAALASADLRTVARPYLRELVDRLNETANLAILDRGEVVYIDQIEANQIVIVKMFARIGSRGPAHCTASGKVLLAGLPEEDLVLLLRKMPLQRFTEKTITDPEHLLAELRAIRAQGFSLDRGERDEGVFCVAVPVKNHEGKVIAAVSISAPAVRADEATVATRFLPVVKSVAEAISARMGFSACVERK
ncbi:MAG: IclR family transcriptional regulator [Firmicutes bacterium]|nr:IclR family transcriptional regulator [Bacillota bacterium]